MHVILVEAEHCLVRVILSESECCVVHVILVEPEYCLKYVTLLMHECYLARASCRCTSQGQCTFVLRHGSFVHNALFAHVLSFTVKLLFDLLLSYASYIFFVRSNIFIVTCLY